MARPLSRLRAVAADRDLRPGAALALLATLGCSPGTSDDDAGTGSR